MANIDVSVILKAKDEASRVLQSLGGQIGKTGRDFRNFKTDLLVATTAIAGVGAGVIALAKQAGDFDLVKNAFNSMTEDMETNADSLVKTVQGASKGLISEYDIIKNANRALSLIGKQSFNDFESEFSEMAEYAIKAGQAMGESSTFMFDSLVKGIGRASPMILDNLGIQVKASEVFEAYAASIGKAADELDSMDQKAAIQQAALQQLREKYGDVQIDTDNFSIKLEALKVKVVDTAKAIGGEEGGLVDQLTKLVDKFIELPEETQTNIVKFAILAPLVGAAAVAFNALWGAALTLVGILTSPVVLAIGAVIAAIFLLIKAYQANIEGLKKWKEFIERQFERIKIVVESTRFIWEWVLDKIQERHNKFSDDFWAFAADVQGIIEKIIGIAVGLKNAWVEEWRQIIQPVKDLWNWLGSLDDRISNFGKNIVGDTGKWIANKLGIPGYATGGVVPGPVGSSQLAEVHGGEEIIPLSRSSSGSGANVVINLNIPLYAGTETEKRNIAEQIYSALARSAASRNMTVAEMMGA